MVREQTTHLAQPDSRGGFHRTGAQGKFRPHLIVKWRWVVQDGAHVCMCLCVCACVSICVCVYVFLVLTDLSGPVVLMGNNVWS